MLVLCDVVGSLLFYGVDSFIVIYILIQAFIAFNYISLDFYKPLLMRGEVSICSENSIMYGPTSGVVLMSLNPAPSSPVKTS
jgi:hypothetical protein